MYYYVYDIETYPNCYTVAVMDYQTGERWVFEMSWRRDDSDRFVSFIDALRNISGAVMVGFNNLGFDYPIIHETYGNKGRDACVNAYAKCQAIIKGDSFEHMIWPSDVVVPQIDLYKIHHFDNQARRTSLKQVEFNMRVPNLQDLPFTPGTHLDSDQIDALIRYNMEGDVYNTARFLTETLPAIDFRSTFGKDHLNYNDTKIGKKYLIKKLEDAGIDCFDASNQPRQTRRSHINLGDAVIPWIQFQHPEFQRIVNWFRAQTITETKGVFTDIECTVDDFKYVFGLGGIHGSVESQTVRADDEMMIEDWDVASYYPNLAIANDFYPEHLGREFCDIYKNLYEQRKGHAKGTPMNAALKLALNGVYGDTNSRFSPFYDPLYTMRITINGQLLLCMLAEALRNCPQLQMVQINTDGLTIRYPRAYKDYVHQVCQWWEGMTQLQLENVEYERMHIRDVNNYVAVGVDGKIKRKGAYEYERAHHQNNSALVVPKATELVLTKGLSPRQAVMQHTDMFDFCLFVKSPRLELDGVPQQGRTRYYVSTTGGTLVAVKPPPPGMKKGDYKKGIGVSNAAYHARNRTGVHDPSIHTKSASVYGDQISEVEKGWKVTVCNDILHCTNPINYDYYIDRVNKLVRPLQ